MSTSKILLKFIRRRRVKIKMKDNILDRVGNLLKSKEKYLSEDGELLKAKVYSDIMTMDKGLLKLLLSDEKIKKAFFVKIDDTLVFDKQKFAWIIDSKEFLPDSYTAYTNKIGLTSNGDFISQKNDVILEFPYKDCVLEGGQTKDDQKRKEIFYNETLASSEIRRMLDPKVFTNAKRYTKDGVEEDISFDEEDNLIIKGNNLIALSSLLERYEGQVKCIYIDPPYNTGSDSFGYNDSFNRSTWLTFMKNRLEISKKLLSEDGSIFMSIDEKQEAYLKVLMDEIFGEENLLEIFHVQVRYTSKSLNEKDDFQPVMEYVLAYAKNKKNFIPNKPFKDYDLSKFKWEIIEKEPGKIIELGGKKVEIFNSDQYEIKLVNEPNIDALKDTWASGSVLTGNTSGKFFDQHLSKRKEIDGLNILYKVEGIGEDGLEYRYFTGPKRKNATRGQFYSGVPVYRRQEIKDGTSKKYYPIVNLVDIEEDINNQYVNKFEDLSGSFGNIRHEGGVDFNNGKKPETMIKQFIEIASNPGDLILDFFIGSGSTVAVAHKINRQFIGIEQMDYIEDKAVQRMLNVINGDQTGISKAVNWQGGGSFVYCELMENVNELIREIENADENNIKDLKVKIYKDERIVPYITREELEKADKDFEELNLEEKKKSLIKLVDKNKLYVNYSDIDNADYTISDADKKFTKSFYEVD